ncbi:hypothetical protein Sjap_011587 [Stephania japonica]|uniref:Uncharacterized protein n=1 Tax=Stephania japonica TaxID=461633 RepID=A0AAP0JDP8_9MAGN
MESNGNETLWSFLHEKENAMQHQHSPPRLSHHAHIPTNDHHQQLSPKLVDSPLTHALLRASSSSSPPSDPDSPWMLTPRHPSPSPTLLYHCIASLHRQKGNIRSIAALKGIVFTGSESSRIHVWRTPECIERGHLKTTSGDVQSILAYGNLLFTGHKDRKVRIWNLLFADNFRAKKISTLPRQRSFLSILRKGNNQDQHKDCIY